MAGEQTPRQRRAEGSLRAQGPRGELRAFFALDLCEEARRAAGGIIRELRARPSGDQVRWVRAETLHMTLRFLGRTARAHVPALLQHVASQLEAVPAFMLDLGEVKAFPSLRHPRVVALDLEPEAPVLHLARAVDAGVVAAGFEPEPRPFRGHVTLGRAQSAGRTRHGGIPSLEGLAPRPPTPCAVREIVLFESTLGSEGSIYTPLERIALGCGAAADAASQSQVHPDSGVPEETPHGHNDRHTR
ncbi:MAG TPA: RNA 2',3'-cyclic phosphodiesterase [Myxococcota bacterium]|nr:RNA 2',3'-cyclic phosphodiesterase [Myxococcota bacterium]